MGTAEPGVDSPLDSAACYPTSRVRVQHVGGRPRRDGENWSECAASSHATDRRSNLATSSARSTGERVWLLRSCPRCSPRRTRRRQGAGHDPIHQRSFASGRTPRWSDRGGTTSMTIEAVCSSSRHGLYWTPPHRRWWEALDITRSQRRSRNRRAARNGPSVVPQNPRPKCSNGPVLWRTLFVVS